MENLTEVNQITVIAYFLIGGFFAISSWIVFIQLHIDNDERLLTSAKFLALSFIFSLAGGKIMTGHGSVLTLITLVACLFLVYISVRRVIDIYRKNQRMKHMENQKS